MVHRREGQGRGRVSGVPETSSVVRSRPSPLGRREWFRIRTTNEESGLGRVSRNDGVFRLFSVY